MDYTVWINVTAPYASGMGRRTIWRGHARVDAVSTEQALRTGNFQSVGKTVLHNEHQAMCVLGKGWEIHLNCPGEKEHCKACGSPVPAGYCRDCTPEPKAKGVKEPGESELAAKVERVPVGKMRKVGENKPTRKRSGRSKRRALKQKAVQITAEDMKGLFDEF